MSKLTISRAVEQLHQRTSAYAIGALQELRVHLKGLQRTSSRTIFSSATTYDTYAFHHGGRSELQFNIGLESLESKEYLRYGVAFSLETSRSLPNIDILIPKIRLFNEFLADNIAALSGLEMWHFKNNERSHNRFPAAIPAALVRPGVFVFLGALQPTDQVDYDEILARFDLLLPLYKFVESNGAVPPYKDSPATFAFRVGNRTKMSSTIVSQTERQLSISLRHNELQAALFAELCAEYGPDNVGTETTSGSGGRIDAVVKGVEGYTFYEIKVGHSPQACVREAIGQLLEYSYWPGSQNAVSLVIVGEPALDSHCTAYLERLRRDLSIPISYRQILCGCNAQQDTQAYDRSPD